MAKKKGTFSYLETQHALESIAETATCESLVYDLLRIFCNYGDASIERIKDGRGNDAKDGKTVLVKKLIAYRASDPDTADDNSLYGVLDTMREDATISKKEPRLYVAFDGHRVVGYDPKENDIYDNDIALLWKDFDFFKPLAGIEKVHNYEEAEADVKSAEIMAKIYDDISRYNDIRNEEQVHNINVFMTRLLFCFFAEDTGLFPIHNMFSDAIRENTKADASDLAEFLDGLFTIMATNDKGIRDAMPKVVSQFPYVNGGLFEHHIPIPVLSRRTRMLMMKCAEYDWGKINPDIFGSMIQAVVSPEHRSGLGIHYTSVPNIMKVIRPLFLDELTEDFVRSRDDEKKLRQLLERLSNIKFFDPACGSGNFLIIAYKCVRGLEIEIWKRLRELGVSLIPFSNITLTQFYGIELDEYACDTAKLSLWLAEHQINNQFNDELGVKAEALPLRPSGNIVCGNACRLDWNSVCPHTPEEEVYIMGNPPYYGSSLQTDEQKEDLTIVCNRLKGYKNLDYIASWFYKGAFYIQNSNASYAFVSTNSLCQGEQVAILWEPILNMNLEISFAYTAFKWKNNAKSNATVACVIVGVSNIGSKGVKRLYNSETSRIVSNINPYLSASNNIIVSKISKSLCGLPQMDYGSKAADGGHLSLSVEEKSIIENEIPHRFIKSFIGAQEFIDCENRYCIWITEEDKEQAYGIPVLKRRFDSVYTMRMKSKKKATNEDANRPHQFSEIRYREEEAILIPSVSSERREYIPIGFVDSNTVISNSAFAMYGADLWIFSVIMSKMHNVWVRATCGALETRIRYSATLGYNTFPFPNIDTERKGILRKHAEDIILTREYHVEMTLGEMYNPETMPQDLKYAHQALDIAVERCYRPEPFTSDEERLEHLFKLYEKMTK